MKHVAGAFPSMVHRIFAIACLPLLLADGSFAQQPADRRQGTDARPPDWTVEVIKLHYADSEEMAALLAQVLPLGVTVVAYPPTNSLLIAGDAAVIAGVHASGAGDADARNKGDEVSEAP
jgi:hypothetical protein